MTPFPESEDMTIKRLYVALKRSDEQLLKIGIQKLQEKFHMGHKFEYKAELKEILDHARFQNIPENLKSPLCEILDRILSGETSGQTLQMPEREPVRVMPIRDDIETVTENNPAQNTEVAKEEAPQYNAQIPAAAQEQQIQNTQIPVQNQPVYEKEPVQEIQIQTQSFPQQNEAPVQNTSCEPIIRYNQEPVQNATPPVEQYTPPAQPQIQEPVQGQLPLQTPEPPKIFTPETLIAEQKFEEEKKEYGKYEEKEEMQNTINNNWQENSWENNWQSNTNRKPSNGNIAVFYDDKAPFIDYKTNKLYRSELNLLTLGEDKNIIDKIAAVKSAVDVPTDEVYEILKMLNTTKGDVYFVTNSKSENIIKAFIQNYVSFDIPQITKQQFEGKTTLLIPLLGLSNVFFCPKCGAKEYFGGVHNKVLSLQCKACSNPMYPDVYEAENLETNANPYYFVTGLNSMANSDTWILINPPIEPDKSLFIEFLKAAFETGNPKKVYIYSKETSKREFYKQMFREIHPDTEICGDYSSCDSLCGEFINYEMAAVGV